MKKWKRDYYAHKTIAEFHASDAFYRGIMGPVGSGKSTGCAMEGLIRGSQQLVGPNGRRTTRGAIIRNTYRELKDTTLKTWLHWFPEEYFGDFQMGDMVHHIRYKDVDMEVLFRALDRPGDVKKVLSLELTWAWVNEAREVPFSIIEALGDRVGRYPPIAEGGCTWRGVFMDTNAPDDDHWWYHLSEVEPPDPDVWQFFKQPGGLLEQEGHFSENPLAENLENLEPGYYIVRKEGKKLDHIRIYYCSQYGFIIEGKPVHEEFVDNTHVAKEKLRPVPGRTVYVGLDFGLTPAALIGQRLVDGRWRILQELISERMGISRFADLLRPELASRYEGYEIDIYGDPAGMNESETDETTPFDILEAKGIPAKPAYHNNDRTIRFEALYQPLTRMIDGKPGLEMSPECRITRKALNGGYCFKKMAVLGQEKYHLKPEKNRYSHPAEALEYMLLGAGEGRELLDGDKDYSKLHYSAPRRRTTRPDRAWMGS